MLQLGFIGCGGISRAHLDGLVQLKQEGRERFVLRAVCDPDRARAEARLGHGSASPAPRHRTELFEPVRRAAEVELTTTGEDAAVVVLRFASGALGHWMCATAAHGERASGAIEHGRAHAYEDTVITEMETIIALS